MLTVGGYLIPVFVPVLMLRKLCVGEFISEVEPLGVIFTGHPVARKDKEKICF